MRGRHISVVLIAALVAAGCVVPSADVATTTTTTEASSTTTTVPTTTTTAPTTTTTIDPTETFLAEVPEAPTLIAVSEGGYRRWEHVDGSWSGGPLVRFEQPGSGGVPMAAGTAAGVVYQGGDGSIRFAASGSGEDVIAEPGFVLYDVITMDSGTEGTVDLVAIAGPDGITGIDVATGTFTEIFEARVPQESASYGGGQLLIVRGTGAEAVASLVTRTGQAIRLDLLASGNPISAVLTPDGSQIAFSTDATDDATVYTLAVGSQGPAAAHPLGIQGQVDRLDTDGSWVTGAVDDTPFIVDLSSGEVFFGPERVRFAFDRGARTLAQTPTSTPEAGRFFGFIRSAREGSIRFDEADYLTGEAAAEAAEEAGDESPPPNDFYIRNTSEETRRIPLAEEVEIRVQASYPEAGVDWEAISIDQWLRLIEGDATAVDFDWYGQGTLPYWVTIEDGSAVLLEEFYLP
jgi:hypothetical protein